MNGNDPKSQQSDWIRLIATRLFDIIHTEHTVGQCIRLYEAGNCWYAFEESAYQLSRLFGTRDIVVIRHKDYPFPVVMTSISDEALQTYGKSHIFRRQVNGYRELAGMKISTEQYKEWYRREILEVPDRRHE